MTYYPVRVQSNQAALFGCKHGCWMEEPWRGSINQAAIHVHGDGSCINDQLFELIHKPNEILPPWWVHRITLFGIQAWDAHCSHPKCKARRAPGFCKRSGHEKMFKLHYMQHKRALGFVWHAALSSEQMRVFPAENIHVCTMQSILGILLRQAK